MEGKARCPAESLPGGRGFSTARDPSCLATPRGFDYVNDGAHVDGARAVTLPIFVIDPFWGDALSVAFSVRIVRTPLWIR